MPELPEVETVRNYLSNEILGDKIKIINLRNVKSLRNSNKEGLAKIKGQTILKIDRFAKHLIFNLTDHYLILHLRMEGKFFVFKDLKEMEENSNRFHDILILETDKHVILFQDTRRFATIDIFKNEIKLEDNPIFKKVAKEPFKITGKELYNKIHKKTLAIKSALLDQKIISGIGNIYADEVLFAVKIHPKRKCKDVTITECNDIIKSSISILNKSILLKGTTIKSFASSFGVSGQYQNYLKIHQKEGEFCSRDKTIIEKIKVGGRGTYFCKTCQK